MAKNIPLLIHHTETLILLDYQTKFSQKDNQ